MSQARVYLFTLAECCRHRSDERVDEVLRTAMGRAVDQVTGCPEQLCIVCGTRMAGAPSYLSLLLPQIAPGVIRAQFGGLCIECGIEHERGWLQRFVEHNAHLTFGDVMGHA